MRRKPLLIVPVALLLSITTVAQADKVDEFVRSQLKAQNIPGLSLVVLKHGEIVKTRGYGFIDKRARIPSTPETVYKIASVSKQFIATGIMLLVQDGLIAIDDPVSKYLEGSPATWKEITIRHLLTHTSGLVREAPGFDPNEIKSDAALIKSAYGTPLRFRPGDRWEYANLPYFVLADIIRRLSGRPWTEFLDERVFKPCGMHTTYPTNTRMVLANRARGYVDNDSLRDAPEWRSLRASGAFLSTVLDLAKWDAALYTDKVLSQTTRQQMWTPVRLNDGTSHPYGFGWFVESRQGRTVVHHSGGMPGFRAAFTRFLDDGLTIIVLMNLDDVDKDAIVAGIAAMY